MMTRIPARSFRGLNNVSDPQRLDLSWLTTADNVDITDTNAVVRCRGFTQRTSNFAITGAYATRDLQRLYVVDAGELRQMHADLTYTVLSTGLSSAKMYFEEVNGVVYATNGVDFLAIEQTRARPWGIPTPDTPDVVIGSGTLDPGTYLVACTFVDDRGMESSNSNPAVAVVLSAGSLTISGIPQLAGYSTNVYVTTADGTVFYRIAAGAPSALTWNGGEMGVEIPFWNLDQPRGTLPAAFQGRMYVAEAFPEFDQTVIWRSLPLQFHHFDPSGEALAVPGSVRMLRATESVLIIGTERAIYAWDGEKLMLLADYGVVPGYHATVLDDKLLFWSLRGLCRAMPFENLTQSTLSVAPGLVAGATVMEKDGHRRYVVVLQKGGAPYNARP